MTWTPSWIVAPRHYSGMLFGMAGGLLPLAAVAAFLALAASSGERQASSGSWPNEASEFAAEETRPAVLGLGLFGRRSRGGCASSRSAPRPAPANGSPSDRPLGGSPATAARPADGPWKPLFDGRTLSGWTMPEFGGEGEVYVENGSMILDFGNDLTGANLKEKTPTMNYEVSLEAMRVEGSDFFCGFTFPVGQAHCSFIVGGWGGGVSGISSLDGFDASENETTRFREFKNGKWYRVRVRVTPAKIECWIDDEKYVDVETAGRTISTRSEVNLSKPFGFSTWRTRGALRAINIRAVAGPASPPGSGSPR
jgi:hypothetical protein